MKKRGDPGIEPGTSCTLNKNHTTRPIARSNDSAVNSILSDISINLFPINQLRMNNNNKEIIIIRNMKSNSTAQRSQQFQPISLEQKVQNQKESLQIVKHGRHFGNLIPIMIDPITLQPKYILGPHYFLFIPAWFIATGLLIFFLVMLAGKSLPILYILSILLGILFLYCFAKVGFSLPGIASNQGQPDFGMRSNERYCVPCRIVRPKGTHHCYYCDVCILEMDHHCPWVGKCIGRDNLIMFYKFLTSLTLLMICLILAAVFPAESTE